MDIADKSTSRVVPGSRQSARRPVAGQLRSSAPAVLEHPEPVAGAGRRRDPSVVVAGVALPHRHRAAVDAAPAGLVVDERARRRAWASAAVDVGGAGAASWSVIQVGGARSTSPRSRRLEHVAGPQPAVVEDLAAVDDDLARRHPGEEEPGGEALRGDGRRRPARERHELVRVDGEAALLGGLARRGSPGGRLVAARRRARRSPSSTRPPGKTHMPPKATFDVRCSMSTSSRLPSARARWRRGRGRPWRPGWRRRTVGRRFTPGGGIVHGPPSHTSMRSAVEEPARPPGRWPGRTAAARRAGPCPPSAGRLPFGGVCRPVPVGVPVDEHRADVGLRSPLTVRKPKAGSTAQCRPGASDGRERARRRSCGPRPRRPRWPPGGRRTRPAGTPRGVGVSGQRVVGHVLRVAGGLARGPTASASARSRAAGRSGRGRRPGRRRAYSPSQSTLRLSSVE